MADSSSSVCSICLGPVVHAAYVDPCKHKFCYGCIKRWEKMRRVCPLCKGNIQDIESRFEHFDYASIKANSPEAMERLERMRTTFLSFVSSEAVEKYGFKSSANYRLRIYEFGLWAQRRTDSPLDSCPELYRATDAWHGKIILWLLREMSALYSGSTIQAALKVFRLIRRYPIRSPEFASRVVEYTGRFTEHFVHEFHSYASSSNDIFQYDYLCRYVTRDRLIQEAGPSVITLSDSSDDDCVFVASYPRHSSNPEVIWLDSADDVSERASTSNAVLQVRPQATLVLSSDDEPDLQE